MSAYISLSTWNSGVCWDALAHIFVSLATVTLMVNCSVCLLKAVFKQGRVLVLFPPLSPLLVILLGSCLCTSHLQDLLPTLFTWWFLSVCNFPLCFEISCPFDLPDHIQCICRTVNWRAQTFRRWRSSVIQKWSLKCCPSSVGVVSPPVPPGSARRLWMLVFHRPCLCAAGVSSACSRTSGPWEEFEQCSGDRMHGSLWAGSPSLLGPQSGGHVQLGFLFPWPRAPPHVLHVDACRASWSPGPLCSEGWLEVDLSLEGRWQGHGIRLPFAQNHRTRNDFLLPFLHRVVIKAFFLLYRSSG